MRRFIVIVVASLVPVGMWTAGCRQERQAAFPTTPEMASLAKPGKTAEAENPTTPPEIPPAPIDRDIMNLPENGVLARMQAVQDRADQLAGRTVDEGLFSLPGTSSTDMAAARPASARSGPQPSGREFWSKPVAARNTRPVEAPADISAMAPASQVDYIATPPPHYQAPATPAGSRLLPPEDVPGVFLFDDDPLSLHSPPASRRSGLGHTGGDALSAPPSSSNNGTVRQTFGQMRSQETSSKAVARVTERGPIRLDLSGLVPTGSRQSGSVQRSDSAFRNGPTASPIQAYREEMEPSSRPVLPSIPEYQAVSVPIMTISTGPVYEPLPEPVPVSSLAHPPVTGPHPLAVPAAKPVLESVSAGLPLPSSGVAESGKGVADWIPSKLPPLGTTAATRRVTGTMSVPVALRPTARMEEPSKPAKQTSAPLPFEELPAVSARAQTRTSGAAAGDISQALAPLPDLSQAKAKTNAAAMVTTETSLSTVAPLHAREKETISGSAAVSAARASRIPEVTLPQPVPEPVMTPELTAAKTVLMDFSPEALDEVSLPPSLKNPDFFKTDFWDAKSAAALPPVPDKPSATTKKAASPLPELPMPAAPNRRESKTKQASSIKPPAARPEAAVPPEPREPIWVDTIPSSSRQERESVPEYRYEEPKNAAPAAPKRIKLKPIGQGAEK